MREIKFRMPILSDKGEFIQWHYWGFIRESWGMVFSGIPIDPQTAQGLSQQYTGIKDKDGREVYEGDIVKAHNGSLFEVRWADALAAFTTINLCAESWDETMATGWHVAEVVGNIYEGVI